MLKLADNPPMCPPTASSVAELAGPWWVGHTKARFEKAFAFDLLERGIGYYLPMRQRVKVCGGRKRHLLAPLFTSYVFFCGDADARYRALATDRLCNVIPVTDRQKFVAELCAIERMLASGAPLELYPFAAVGMRCRVTAGPREGIVGTVVRREKQISLVLNVSVLGQGLALPIEGDLLEPAD